jgi:hypothetical protein
MLLLLLLLLILLLISKDVFLLNVNTVVGDYYHDYDDDGGDDLATDMFIITITVFIFLVQTTDLNRRSSNYLEGQAAPILPLIYQWQPTVSA